MTISNIFISTAISNINILNQKLNNKYNMFINMLILNILILIYKSYECIYINYNGQIVLDTNILKYIKYSFLNQFNNTIIICNIY